MIRPLRTLQYGVHAREVARIVAMPDFRLEAINNTDAEALAKAGTPAELWQALEDIAYRYFDVILAIDAAQAEAKLNSSITDPQRRRDPSEAELIREIAERFDHAHEVEQRAA